MDKQDNQQINFGLVKVTTEQFAILENNFQDQGPFNLNINFRFAADKEKKIIGVFAGFSFEIEEKPFLILEAGCHFSIIPDSWSKLLDTETNVLTVPKGLIQHLSVITVGTARGILHAKTEGSAYNRFHLPTINVAQMITEDQLFEFEKDK